MSKQPLTHQELNAARSDPWFAIDEFSPGSIIYLPSGFFIYQQLTDYLRKHYKLNGYSEVQCPDLWKKHLWDISGHSDKYAENMFQIVSDNPNKNEHLWCRAMSCISGDAIVSFASHSSRRLDSLIDNEEQILGYDNVKKGLVPTTQHKFLNQGMKDCVELLFLDGRKIICTPDHKILTSDGWTEASNLKVGIDKVKCGIISPEVTYEYNFIWKLELNHSFIFTLNNRTSFDKTIAFMRLCGLLITDGSISYGRRDSYFGELYLGHEIDFENVKKDMLLVTNVCDHRFRTDRNLWCVNITAKFANVLGNLFGVGNRMYSDSKFPDFIMDDNIPVILLRQFLSGMFGGDGWAPILSNKKFTGVFMSLSKIKDKLPNLFIYMNDLVKLLEKAGVPDCTVTGPYRNDVNTTKKDTYNYRVKVPMSQITNFCKFIGYAYNCHKSQKLSIVSSYYSLRNKIIEQNHSFVSKCSEIVSHYKEISKPLDWNNIRQTVIDSSDEYIFSEKFSHPQLGPLKDAIRKQAKLVNIGNRGFFTPEQYLIEINAIDYFKKKYAVPRDTVIPTFELKLLKRTNIGIHNVYDVTVDNNIHSFLANGIIVHNCPCHHRIYALQPRHSSEFPMRLAEFGSVHRNEAEGSLRGLFRVRKFHQDDGHIFCTKDQISQEIRNFLNLLDTTYNMFGLKYTLELSTRPEQSIGTDEQWNHAEKIMQNELEAFGKHWTLNKGGGSFYSPKIDIHVTDSLGRSHQCGTIQLDFQLPERFDIWYTDDQTGERLRPSVLHRAVFGSLERIIGILLEHYQGDLPLWLSDKQFLVCSLYKKEQDQSKVNEYVKQIRNSLLKFDWKIRVDIDTSDTHIKQKVKSASEKGYHYILVIGDKEVEANTVTVRQGRTVEYNKTVEDVCMLYKNLMGNVV